MWLITCTLYWMLLCLCIHPPVVLLEPFYRVAKAVYVHLSIWLGICLPSILCALKGLCLAVHQHNYSNFVI